MFTLLDLCVSSLRRGHANLLCIVPILTDDPRRESDIYTHHIYIYIYIYIWCKWEGPASGKENWCWLPYSGRQEKATGKRQGQPKTTTTANPHTNNITKFPRRDSKPKKRLRQIAPATTSVTALFSRSQRQYYRKLSPCMLRVSSWVWSLFWGIHG